MKKKTVWTRLNARQQQARKAAYKQPQSEVQLPKEGTSTGRIKGFTTPEGMLDLADLSQLGIKPLFQLRDEVVYKVPKDVDYAELEQRVFAAVQMPERMADDIKIFGQLYSNRKLPVCGEEIITPGGVKINKVEPAGYISPLAAFNSGVTYG